MKRIVYILMAAAITGCVATPQRGKVATPLSPPLPIVTKAARVRIAVAQAQPVESVIQAAALEPWVPEKLYIESRAGSLYLSWMTNSLKTALLTTTNLTTPMVQWQLLGTQCKTLENDHWLIQVTNRDDAARFYRLLSVPTNSIMLGWSYQFTENPTVFGFGLLEGPAANTYTNTTPIPGKVLWGDHPVAQTTNTIFYAIVAMSTNGVSSPVSSEVYFTPGNSNSPFAPPCP